MALTVKPADPTSLFTDPSLNPDFRKSLDEDFEAHNAAFFVGF